jgi:CRISPR-associated protein Csb2
MYVPNNAADLVTSAWARGNTDASIAEHRVEKDVRPTLLTGEAVHYLFPLGDGTCPHLEVLKAATRSITHLGWGIDMVAANAAVIPEADADKLHGERWRPVKDSSGRGLRVPVVGTLDALIAKHAAFLTRLGPKGFKPVPPLSAFRVVGYRRATDPVHRPFVAFRFWHPQEDRMAYFPATRAVTVAGMIRHATAEAARRSGWDEADVAQYILGHRDNPDDSLPRFAYVPLPTIEPPPRNVVGGIRRVLIAEPLDSPGEHIAWLKQIMPGQVIIDNEGSEVAVLERIGTDGVIRRYVDRAITWTTVTPVALPGSDEGKADKTDKLLSKMFRHAGYSIDDIAELDFHRVPFLRGGEDARRYRPKQPHYLANCTMYHMRIRWKHPMPGPIVLGSGRFCGLGVFATFGDD